MKPDKFRHVYILPENCCPGLGQRRQAIIFRLCGVALPSWLLAEASAMRCL